MVEKLSFSVVEAAEAAGLSPRFVRELIAAGKLPVARLGSRVLVRRTDLETLLKESVAPYVPMPIGRGARKSGR